MEEIYKCADKIYQESTKLLNLDPRLDKFSMILWYLYTETKIRLIGQIDVHNSCYSELTRYTRRDPDYEGVKQRCDEAEKKHKAYEDYCIEVEDWYNLVSNRTNDFKKKKSIEVQLLNCIMDQNKADYEKEIAELKETVRLQQGKISELCEINGDITRRLNKSEGFVGKIRKQLQQMEESL